MSEPTELTPDEAKQALIDWAKEDIIRLTTIRFDIAKFFFSVSAFSIGFIPTIWKVLYPNKPFTDLAFVAMALLFVSLLVSIYIFWPIFHSTGANVDLRIQHEKMANQIRTEGVTWAVLWISGILISGYAVFLK